MVDLICACVGGGGRVGGWDDIHSETPMTVPSEDCELTGNFIHTS